MPSVAPVITTAGLLGADPARSTPRFLSFILYPSLRNPSDPLPLGSKRFAKDKFRLPRPQARTGLTRDIGCDAEHEPCWNMGTLAAGRLE